LLSHAQASVPYYQRKISHDLFDPLFGLTLETWRKIPILRRADIQDNAADLLSRNIPASHCPLTGFHDFRDIAPIRQYQLVQKSLERIEVRYVVDRPLTPEEEEKLRAVIQNALGHPFELSFHYFDELTKTSGGKFEEFISEVAA